MAVLRIVRTDCRAPRGRREQSLRALVRLVLAWFCLSLGVAVASPIVHPQALELVCSVSGASKLVVQTDEGAREMGAMHLDCALCLPAALAPPPAVAVLPPLLPRAHVAPPVLVGIQATATALRPPVRAPPLL